MNLPPVLSGGRFFLSPLHHCHRHHGFILPKSKECQRRRFLANFRRNSFYGNVGYCATLAPEYDVGLLSPFLEALFYRKKCCSKVKNRALLAHYL
jgi:hypothetical protein